MSDINHKLDLILNTIAEFKEEFTSFKNEANKNLDRIQATLTRIEDERPFNNH